MRNKCSKS